MNPFDALLIFPPPYVPTELQPGISAIKGYCEQRGKNIEIIDANINAIEYVLKKIDPFVQESINILKNIENYLPKNFLEFEKAKDNIERIADLVKGEKFGLRRNTVTYIPKYESQSIEGIITALQSPNDNIFNEYFENELIPEIRKYDDEGLKFMGIGITDRKQSIPGFLIADKIKKDFPNIKVIVGGNFISRSREVFKNNSDSVKRLFTHLDYLVFLEGDEAFYKLINNDPIDTIDKIIWYNDITKFNDFHTITKAENFPIPNPKGLLSWTPEPVPAYNFQRGCNFGVCKFCAIMDGYDSFSMRTKDKPAIFAKRLKGYDDIIKDLKKMTDQGYRYFNFTDETFFAKDMAEISKRLIEKNLDIRWTAYARVEKEYLDKEFCDIISKAGCDFLQFGVESLSVRNLQNMRKGTDNYDIKKILKNTHDAEIMNHVFLLVGNPGETIEESMLLLPFLEDTKNCTFTVKPTWFKLARGSPYAYAPERTVKRLFTEPELAPNLHYEPISGMSKKVSHAMNDVIQMWIDRYHTNNYVAGTYCYSQRFFSGYKNILKIARDIEAGKIEKDKDFLKDKPYSKDEQNKLNIVWKAIIGEEYSKLYHKYLQGNRNPKFIESYNRIKKTNIYANMFPEGFKSIDDVMSVAKIVEQNL